MTVFSNQRRAFSKAAAAKKADRRPAIYLVFISMYIFLINFALIEVCPLEHDNSTLIVVLGGETSESGENKHSTSIEVENWKLVCFHLLV